MVLRCRLSLAISSAERLSSSARDRLRLLLDLVVELEDDSGLRPIPGTVVLENSGLVGGVLDEFLVVIVGTLVTSGIGSSVLLARGISRRHGSESFMKCNEPSLDAGV